MTVSIRKTGDQPAVRAGEGQHAAHRAAVELAVTTLRSVRMWRHDAPMPDS